MATKKQVTAAKRNVKRAQAGAKQKRSIASMPASRRRGSLPMRSMMPSAMRRWRSHCCMAAAMPIPPANRKM